MKALISAYACEPGKGSEPGVGWNWVCQIAHFADEVWVITRINNREVIEEALAKEPLPNIHWVYFDLPHWARFWKKGQRGVHLYYYLWQIGIYFLARRLHRQVKFDLVHHLTFGNYWMPSFLALLPAPFIWGPVGGGESAPKSFYRTFSRWGRFYEYLRYLARWLGEHDPFVRLTAKKSLVALVSTLETHLRIKNLGAENMIYLAQMGVDADEIAKLETISLHAGNPFRFISIGRLLHWKGFHLGLTAFARFVQKFPQSEYWIVGDGPERKDLEQLARELSVADKVRFWGALPRQNALMKLAECDVLVHPSLHDHNPSVCLEAMAAGRPVICLNLGGPALQVTEETGFKISARMPEEAIEEMVQAMYILAQNPKLLRQMGETARQRVKEQFSWEKKGESMERLYQEIMGGFQT